MYTFNDGRAYSGTMCVFLRGSDMYGGVSFGTFGSLLVFIGLFDYILVSVGFVLFSFVGFFC